jgi:hypothetical protein
MFNTTLCNKITRPTSWTDVSDRRADIKRRKLVPRLVPGPYRFYTADASPRASLLFSLLRVHDLISAPLTTMEIQKLRYADPRNRTKIEKFSQKGECFLL